MRTNSCVSNQGFNGQVMLRMAEMHLSATSAYLCQTSCKLRDVPEAFACGCCHSKRVVRSTCGVLPLSDIERGPVYTLPVQHVKLVPCLYASLVLPTEYMLHPVSCCCSHRGSADGAVIIQAFAKAAAWPIVQNYWQDGVSWRCYEGRNHDLSLYDVPEVR